MSAALEDSIILTTRGKIAIITLNLEKKLNALSQELYYRLSCLMREIAARDDIYITLLTGKGRYFSAYTDPQSVPPSFDAYCRLLTLTNSGVDLQISRSQPTDTDVRKHTLQGFVVNNLEITNAFYTHPKILITALNGPAIGLSAALIALSDFIYAMPHAFLLTPFTSLGLVAEGGSSRAFVQRLGISKANEALIMSKRITAEEMLHVGFINKIFDLGKDEQNKFLEEVLKYIDERLGDHLNSDSLLKVKALIRKPERDIMAVQSAAEVFEGLERFAAGIPYVYLRVFFPFQCGLFSFGSCSSSKGSSRNLSQLNRPSFTGQY